MMLSLSVRRIAWRETLPSEQLGWPTPWNTELAQVRLVMFYQRALSPYWLGTPGRLGQFERICRSRSGLFYSTEYILTRLQDWGEIPRVGGRPSPIQYHLRVRVTLLAHRNFSTGDLFLPRGASSSLCICIRQALISRITR